MVYDAVMITISDIVYFDLNRAFIAVILKFPPIIVQIFIPEYFNSGLPVLKL